MQRAIQLMHTAPLHSPSAMPHTPEQDSRPRVAVVGSGLAGLTTAYLLVKEGADVWIVDKAERLGFHAWSVELGGDSGASENKLQLTSGRGSKTTDKKFAVDVPMRSFQGGYYPLLIALYKHLGLTLQPQRYTFSFSTLPGQDVLGRRPRKADVYMTYTGASGTSFPSVPSHAWSDPMALIRAIVQLLTTGVCFLVLIVTAAASWHGLLSKTRTFREVVESVASTLEHPLPLVYTPLGSSFRRFASDVLVPLFSSVGTMTAEDLWTTPAHHILEYIHAGMGTSHYSLGKGESARDVARLLSDPVRAQGEDHIRLGTTIKSITQRRGSLLLSLDDDELLVDKLVLATPASVTRSLLIDLRPSLPPAEAKSLSTTIEALSDIQYRNTIVVTHRDHNVLPTTDIKDINLVVPPTPQASDDSPSQTPALSSPSSTTPSSTPSSAPSSPCPSPVRQTPYFEPSASQLYTMATHLVRAPGDLVLQTTNPVIPIDGAKILGLARLERALPLCDERTLDALRGQERIFIAGSYAYPGIPLLEGCVGSARRVVRDVFGQAADGGVDWEAGRGSMLGRAWRWRFGSEF